MWNDNNTAFLPTVCRICANIAESVTPIFGKEIERERIDLKIHKCLPIVVRKEDGKPKQVCLSCVTKLEMYMDFVELCLSSDFKFEAILQNRFPYGTAVDVESLKCDSVTEAIPLLGPRTNRNWPEDVTNNPVQIHDEGVIVLSKGDSEAYHREDNQDILLLVELKYKDVEANSQPKTDHSVTYAQEYQLSSDVLSKAIVDQYSLPPNQVITYEENGQNVIPTKNITYSLESEPSSSAKTYTMSYIGEQTQVEVSKIPISYTSENHPIILSSVNYSCDDQPTEYKANQNYTFAKEVTQISLDKISGRSFQGTAESRQTVPCFLDGTQSSNDSVPKQGQTTIVIANSNKSLQDISVTKPVASFSGEIDLNEEKCHILKGENIIYITNNQATTNATEVEKPEDPCQNLENNKNQKENIDPPPKEKPFPCNLCDKSFMRRTNLNVHMAVHTKIRPHACNQCGKQFVLRWELTIHQRIHSGIYSCEFCNKAFSVRGKLERHRRIHTGERPYSCEKCAKAFSDKRNLKAHLQTHSDERPYVCSLCGRRFRVKSHLNDHSRVHRLEAPYSCNVCNKSFKWKINLTTHLRVHTGERFSCSDCGKEFTRRTDVTKHRRSHTDERPYVCSICGKCYTEKGILAKHVQSHESKSFTCEVCGKSFHFSWYLNAHKKTHVGNKVYNCQECKKVFIRKGNLLLHLKSHSTN